MPGLTCLRDKQGDCATRKIQRAVLLIRTKLTTKRSDFDISPGQFEDKVSNQIDMTLSVAGASPK